MSPRSPLVLALLAACGGVPAPTGAPEPVMPTPSDPAPPVAAEDRPGNDSPTSTDLLTGHPLARLRVADNPVVALDHPLPQAELTALGVRSYRAFTATAPRVWLLVLEFATHAQLLAAQPKLSTLLGDDDTPPYYRETSSTGTWLLVTGFPSHKPVSPEMAAARTVFTSQWAGEE